MRFQDYIGIGPQEFQEKYVNTGLVTVNHHEKFPLSIYCYDRKAVYDNVWDNVTSKCRGIIVNRETGDVIARPFEKFHNYGSEQVPVESYLAWCNTTQPTMWEKMDGFLITIYWWDGIPYAASKGSFHSIHAKWATSEIRRYDLRWLMNSGYTLVCEGLHPDLRVVVDYGKRKELVALALINNETGEELTPQKFLSVVGPMGFKVPRSYDMGIDAAVYQVRTGDVRNDEGFVAAWYRDGGVPFRLKLKYLEYLRLHRLVTQVSPKRIWEALANGWQEEMDEMISRSTPWFADFAQKWKNFFLCEYDRLLRHAQAVYSVSASVLGPLLPGEGYAADRKAYALRFAQYPELATILFAMLDSKPVDVVIYKKLKDKAKGNPLVDAHNT